MLDDDNDSEDFISDTEKKSKLANSVLTEYMQ